MPHIRSIEQALLSWINTFPLDNDVESLADLSDGDVFSKMIENINPDYAVHDIEQNAGPSKWLSNKKTLQAVYKSLLRYIGDKCSNPDSAIFESRIDLNAIAEKKNPQETIKLLTIFLMAAVEGPNNRHYINLITTKLDTSTQEEIKKIIMLSNSLSHQTAKTATGSPTVKKDYNLVLEEKFATLQVEHENLKKKHADFMTRFERLTISHEELIQHSNDADTRLRSLQDSKNGDQTGFIKKQIERIRELEDIIANQEQQLEKDRNLKEKQSRELASLRPAAALVTEYQDQLKEIKAENLSLVKKANKVDHYLKKLENHTSLQRENTELRERIDLLEENQKDYDRVHEENARYKKTATEYGNRFQEQELHIVELSSQKNALKQELQILNDRITELNERQQQDEKFINDLQEQIRTSAGPIAPNCRSSDYPVLSLEEELEQVEEAPNSNNESARLKAETRFLESQSANSKIAQLTIDLGESERARCLLEARYQELVEKHTIEHQQPIILSSNPSSENNDTVANTRKLYIEASQELTATKAKLSQLQSELSERDRELSEKNQLIASLSSNKSLPHDLPDSEAQIPIKEDHDHTMMEQDSQKQDFHTYVQEQNTQDVCKGFDLDEEKTLEQMAANSPQIRNLIRENQLLSSAWFDITSLFQNQQVVLQRRTDQPKSWLNAQRKMVKNPARR